MARWRNTVLWRPRRWSDKGTTPAAATNFGQVEGLVGYRVFGWARDVSITRARLSVVIVDRHGRTASGLADCYRADLQAAGYGDGHFGFYIGVKSLDSGGGLDVLAGPDRVQLPGSPIRPAKADGGRERRRGSLRLHLDPIHLSGTRISGWALDRADPTRRPRLGLSDGSRTFVAAPACRYRPERAAGGDDPYCGFELSWSGCPAMLNLVLVDSGERLARIL